MNEVNHAIRRLIGSVGYGNIENDAGKALQAVIDGQILAREVRRLRAELVKIHVKENRMYDFMVTEVDRNTSKHIRRFIVSMPDIKDKGFYRATTSYNAFFSSLKRRNWSDKKIYIPIAECYGTSTKFENPPGVVIDVNHTYGPSKIKNPIKMKSIWDFYKAIGYNYKTKSYVK